MKEVETQTMDVFRKEEEFQSFVAEHRGLWLRLAYRVLENREEAEDTVQETLAILWEKRHDLEVENPGAYAARSVWLNSIKRRGRRKPQIPLEEIAEPQAPEEEGPREGLGDLDPLELEDALMELPEAQRTVIRMKYYMGLSFREIGEALQISLNTAGSRCRYALETLRELLAPEDRPKEPQKKVQEAV
jgi:RNA polymerase sigma-70 factor, ECF subfamily